MSDAELEVTLSFVEASRPEIEEAFYNTFDGLRLYSCVHPVRSPQAVVLMLHGLGEHSGRYGHVIHYFQEKSIAAIRYDTRGHGRSDGKRGHINSYDDLLNDLSMMFRQTRVRFPGIPIILFGHSLGGNIVTNWCLRRPLEAQEITGVVLSSPWFTLTKKQNPLKVWAISTMSKLAPKVMVPASFRPRKLTRNPEVIDNYQHDPLIHKLASVRLISDCYFSGLWALDQAPLFRLPFFALHGTADSVTSPEGTRQFSERAPHGELRLFEDLVHEPHNEPEWRTVVDYMRQWMLNRLAQATGPVDAQIILSKNGSAAERGNVPDVLRAE